MPPSGTEKAKEQFMQGVEKTKAPAESGSSFTSQGSSLPDKQSTNPKQGNYVSKLAKGDTGSSNYDPGAFAGNGQG